MSPVLTAVRPGYRLPVPGVTVPCPPRTGIP